MNKQITNPSAPLPDNIEDVGDECPCIGSCTTVLGDEVCRGCARTFDEVTIWPSMDREAKIAINRRIHEQRCDDESHLPAPGQ